MPRGLVTDASELLVALDLGPAHVAGVGVGGFIAQLLALDHPGQVASLTLVSTRPVAPGPGPRVAEYLLVLLSRWRRERRRTRRGTAGFR